MAEVIPLKDPELILRQPLGGISKLDRDIATIEAKKAEEQKVARPFGESMDDGRKMEWITDLYDKKVIDKDDPNWYWTEESRRKYTDGLFDDDLKDYVLNGGGGSEEAVQSRYDYALQTQETIKRLEEDGWQGVGARVLASLIDPVELTATTALSLGVGTLPSRGFKLLTKGGLVVDKLLQGNKIAKGAALGAGAAMADNLLFEGIRAKLGADRNWEDAALSTIMAAPIGAGLGAAGASIARLAKRHEYDRLVESGANLTDAEKAYYADVSTPKAFSNRVIEHLEGTANDKVIDDAAPLSKVLDGDQKDFSQPLEAFDDAPTIRGSNALSMWLRNKISTSAQLMSHPVGKVRELAGALMPNFAGWSDGRAVKLSANEIQRKYAFQTEVRFYRYFHQQFREFKERTGMDREAFNLDISRYVAGDTSKTYDKSVVEMGERARRIVKQLGDDAVAMKALGFTADAVGNPNYLPRIFDNIRVARIAQDLEDGEINRLVHHAITSRMKAAGKEIDEELDAGLKKFADAYTKAVVNRSTLYNPNVRKFAAPEELIDELEQELTKMFGDDAAVNRIVGLVDSYRIKDAPDAKFSKRAKFRVDLDENASLDLKMKDGSTKTVRFDDLLHRDIEDLLQMYSYQMGGVIGMAKHGIGVTGGQTWDEMLTQLTNELRSAGLKGNLNDLGDKNIQEVIDLLNFGYDTLTGKLAYQDHGSLRRIRHGMNQIRTLSYIWNMGFSGFAAMMEFANVVLDTSFKTSMWKSMPYMKNIIGTMKSGRLKNDLMNELEELSGLGADVATGMRRNQFDPDSDIYFAKSVYNGWDKALNVGREKIGMWSCLVPVTATLRRLSNLYFALDFHSAALKFAKGKDVEPFSRIKMEQLGISPEMNRRILTMINQHATADGSRLKTLNSAKWTDKEAAQAFEDALFKNGVSNVQESFNGSTGPFVRSEMGKTIFQFMGYVLSSQEQQLQRYGARLANGDALKVTSILAGSYLFSTLGYIGRVHFNASGMGEREREQFLEKRLSTQAILKGGLDMTGWLSFYSLMMNGLTGVVGKGDSQRIVNTPVLGLTSGIGNGTFKAFKDLVSDEEDMSDEQWRKVARATLGPLMRLPAIAPITNRLITEINE